MTVLLYSSTYTMYTMVYTMVYISWCLQHSKQGQTGQKILQQEVSEHDVVTWRNDTVSFANLECWLCTCRFTWTRAIHRFIFRSCLIRLRLEISALSWQLEPAASMPGHRVPHRRLLEYSCFPPSCFLLHVCTA